MTDLHSQLRAYGRQIESELTASAGHTDRAPLLGLEPEPPRPRRPLTYGLVPALLIIVVAVPLVLTRSNPPPVATTPAPGTTEVATTTIAVEAEGMELRIRSSSSDLGAILVSGSGQTLYLFTPDNHGESPCDDNRCRLPWVPAEGPAVAGEGVDESLVGTITRSDGTLQATYNGWPLYLHNRDFLPGYVTGQGKDDLWWVIDASGNPAASLDTTAWTTFVSDRYGFSIDYPADWTVLPADHDWTLAADADQWLSTGQEVFLPPTEDIRVSAWVVDLDPDTITRETWDEVEAWVELYCRHTNDPSCTGVHDRAVQLCNERWDCHPGLLVPFEDDVQAFFTGGNFRDQMVVVAVWRGESDPSVAQYGGSRRLLEAFLETMDVCPARLDQVPSGCGPHA